MVEETAQPIAAARKAKLPRVKNKKAARKAGRQKAPKGKFGPIGYPKQAILKCLRIPQAVLENNAGKECTDREAAKFAGLGWNGSLAVEISSALKYKLFQRPAPGKVEPTDITRRILRPQKPTDRVDAYREALLNAPLISDVYKHYRGENLPEEPSFLVNTVTESFKIPEERAAEFIGVFLEDLETAQLIEEASGKKRVLISLTRHQKRQVSHPSPPTITLRKSAGGSPSRLLIRVL
jgi:hypothetical protein